MGTAGRIAPLRRTGSLLGLLGLELAAVVVLHWLGRSEGLRIRWDEPVPWLLSSPVQEVLGAVLRTVGLVMAYWLLVSTLLYLLASLTRLPSAVRAVRWATFPLARRVADHAVAVTLATSMVGGSTLGVAGPALAADSRSTLGPPARKPVAAQASGAAAAQDPPSPAYTPKAAGGEPPSASPKQPAEPRDPAYVPNVEAADGSPPTSTTKPPTSTTKPRSGTGGTGGTGRSETGDDEPYTVERGDNLWSIAKAELEEESSGGSGGPTDRQVARYWRMVVAKFMKDKGSRDPDLIFPEEKIDLPAVPPVDE
jgi:nucleoid-associated protein YgaU